MAGVALTSLIVCANARAGFGDSSYSRAHSMLDPGTPAPPITRGGGPSDPSPELELVPDPNGTIELFPRVPLALAAGWMLPPEPEPEDREARAEAALEQYFDEALHRDQLEAGHVDGWYHATGARMRQEFHPDRQAVERDRHAGMSAWEIVVDELSRYARGPVPPQDVAGQPLPHERVSIASSSAMGRDLDIAEQSRFDWINPLNAAVTWHRVDVRVTHNPEGEVALVWVLHSSGSASLDQAAVTAVHEAARNAPPPPSRVLGERQAIQSDWSFEMGDVATDIGTIGCVDDPIHGGQCSILGRGIVRTRLRLLRVVDEMHPTPEERRAQRRRDAARATP